jgi:Tfp pilus assembly protein PilE
MKNSPKRQRGLGLFGLVFIFAVIGFTALIVMRCWPIYLNQMKIAKAIKNVSTDAAAASAQDSTGLYRSLERFWDVDSIDYLDYKKVKLVRSDRGRAIAYKYEARTPLFYNISLVMEFEDSVPVSGVDN